MTDEFETDNFMLKLLSGIKPIPPDVKEMYKGTEFICGECSGMVIPQTMETGICFHCKEESILSELEYNTDDE